MARIDNGVLGKIRGKVGAVVASSWRGVDVLRSKGPSRRKNNSPAQIEQQAKFKLSVQFVGVLSELFKVTYKKFAKKMTTTNNALAATISQTITGVYPDLAIDFSKVPVSKGKLAQQPGATATSNAGILRWQWPYVANQNSGKPHDKSLLVAYCPAFEHVLFNVDGPPREGGTASLDLTPFMGQTVYTWLAFISEDGNKLSNSFFTGQLVIS